MQTHLKPISSSEHRLEYERAAFLVEDLRRRISTPLLSDRIKEGLSATEILAAEKHTADAAWNAGRHGQPFTQAFGLLLANPYPGERSPFWKAHRLWVSQGRRLAEDGITCIYDIPILKPTKVRKVGRGKYIIIEKGDEGGEFIVVENA